MTPVFGDNILHCMSLSKAGLEETVGIARGCPADSGAGVIPNNMCLHPSLWASDRSPCNQLWSPLADCHASNPALLQSKFTVLETTLDRMPRDLPWFLHRGEGDLCLVVAARPPYY